MFRTLLGNCYLSSKVKLVFSTEYVTEEGRLQKIPGWEIISRRVYYRTDSSGMGEGVTTREMRLKSGV